MSMINVEVRQMQFDKANIQAKIYASREIFTEVILEGKNRINSVIKLKKI